MRNISTNLYHTVELNLIRLKFNLIRTYKIYLQNKKKSIFFFFFQAPRAVLVVNASVIFFD